MFDIILQSIISGITVGFIYTLIALGFNIIYNASYIINFAQGEFVMLGGMIAATAFSFFKLNLIYSLIISTIIVTVIGALIERLAIQPVKNADVSILVIITIGASIFIRGIAMLLWGKDPYIFPSFVSQEPIIIRNAAINRHSLIIIVITIIVILLLQYFFKKTITGKAMRAVADNKRAASLMGINIDKIMLISFGLSGALGSIAGIIVTPITLTTYDIGIMFGLKGFSAAILGGIGNSFGALIGGLLLGIFECLAAALISSGYKDAIAFLVLLFVLFIKPSGILGKATIEKV
ncbi:MAG: branched-chain amino acid ABC transporter permease [Candidatus Aenigmatarchaeota archaeon]